MLLFYISTGSAVIYDNNGERPGCQVFEGWGKVIPTVDQFITNPKRLLHDGSSIFSVFAVRFAVYAKTVSDFTTIDPLPPNGPPPVELWPFQCDTEGTQFVECGYASLHLTNQGRSIERFRRMVQAAQGKPYLAGQTHQTFAERVGRMRSSSRNVRSQPA